MNWQPIETAPKDGTHILASCLCSDGLRVPLDIIRWDDDWNTWVTTGIRYILHPTGDEGDDRFPTHWMPLPDPPQAD